MKRVILGSDVRNRPEFFLIGVMYDGRLIGFLTNDNDAQQDIGDTTKAHGPRFCTSVKSANAVIRSNTWNGLILDNRYVVGRFKIADRPWEYFSGRGMFWKKLVYDVPLLDRSAITYQVYSVDEAYNAHPVDPSSVQGTTLEDIYPGISEYSEFFNSFNDGLGEVFNTQYSSLDSLLHACVPSVVDLINSDIGPRCQNHDRLNLQRDYLDYIPDEIYDEVVSKINPEFLD